MEKLINESNGKIISRKARHAKNFLEKFFGLMLVRAKEFDYALVFHLEKESRLNASIHSMFMLMQIDVLWLDSRKKVVELKQGLKPWVLNVTPKKKAKYVVELRNGTVRKKKIKLGQKINWV